jgi:S-(hydroxymethyl)glutathione dehydrogenase/alcohol dehydrogenase
MQVKAAVAVGENLPLEILELQLREPREGEVLVRMHAAGLCHSDLSMLEGKIKSYTFPIVLGHEGAGTVVRCGPGVEGLVPGDHVVPVAVPQCGECANCLSDRTNFCLEMVKRPPSPFSRNGEAVSAFCGLGTFADHSVIRESQLAKIGPAPDDIVCYIGCGVITGVGAAMKTAGVTPGSSVVIIGMGGIGLSALQGARIAGAARIIAVDLNPAREAISRSFGATDFINPAEVPDLAAAIAALVPGGVDYALECVGRPNLMRLALEVTNPAWGTAVSVGIAPSDTELTFNPASFMTGRTWKGSLLGGEKTRTTIPQLVQWYLDGVLKLDELVTHRIELGEVNHGFDMMKSGEAIRTVVVFPNA